MQNKIEKMLTPIIKLQDNYGEEWILKERPSFYPNMQIHILTYINRIGIQRKVRFDCGGNVIGGYYELGEIIAKKI